MPSENAPQVAQGERRKVVIVKNAEAFDSIVRDVADDKMTASKAELSGVRGFAKKIWKHNIAQEYYRQKEIAKAKKDIEDQGSLYKEQGADNAVHAAAMNALLERFKSEYKEETVHDEAGETWKKEDGPVLSDIQNLIQDYVEGRIADETAFREAKKAILADVTDMDVEKVASGLHQTDNLFEIAKNIKEAVAHGEALEHLLADIEVTSGVAKSGVRTEAQFNTVDRWTEKIQNTRVGRLFHETTIAGAVAIAYHTSARLSQSAAQSRVAAWATFGGTAVVSGGLAMVRESKRLEEERRQHFRDMAKGKTFEKDKSPRREEMETFRYASISASVRTAELRSGIDRTDEEMTKDLFAEGLQMLADTNAHIRLSDQKSIDLLAYSDERLVEEERLNLDIARAEAKVRLRNLAQVRPDLLPDGVTVATLDSHIQGLIGTRVGVLTVGDRGIEGIDQKNRLFKKMKKGRVVKAGLLGVATGLAIGGVAQEGVAFLRDDQQGLVEGLMGQKGGTHATALEGARAYISHLGGWDTVSGPPMTLLTINNGPQAIQVQVPAGATLMHMPVAPGAPRTSPFQLTYQGKTIPDLQFTDTGEFTADSKAKLHAGFPELQISENPQSLITSEKATGSAKECVEKSGTFKSVFRKLWYDNNTPAPIFDQNELRLRLGGVNGTGVDAGGNFVYDVKSMTKGGSFHGAFSVDAQEAIAKGRLGMNFSFKGQADKAFFLPIDPSGKVVIDPSSQIGKMMFAKDPSGKMIFQGGFAEVVEVMDGNTNGAQNVRVLATQVGNNKGMGQVVTWGEDVCKKNTESTLSFKHFAEQKEIDPFPLIPLLARTPLEKSEKNIASSDEAGSRERVIPSEISPVGYGYGYFNSPRDRKEYRDKLAPSLKDNPDAVLDHVQEATAYLEKQEEGYKEKVKLMAAQLGPMSDSCRLSVCIPVAGHQEGENIYKTLEQYLNQKASADSFEVVLFVNRPDVDMDGKEVSPDNTAQEIERFRRDHPELPVRVMDTVLPRDSARIGYIRKLLNDAVLYRHNKRGMAAPDHIFVSNDADLKGVSPDYIQNFATKFNENPKVDGMLGQIDWDPNAYVRNPLVHVGTRLFQYVEAQLRQRDKKSTGSSGANFAFRGSMYAAVGGYSHEMNIVEDVDLGRRIKFAREGSSDHTPITYAGARVSRVYTSARRAENALKNGLAPVEQWSRGFSAFDDDVRKVRWEENAQDVDFSDPDQLIQFKENLETIINRTTHEMSGWGTDRALMNNALRWLGVGVRANTDGSYSITSMKNLIDGLKEYKEQGLEIMKGKTTSEVENY